MTVAALQSMDEVHQMRQHLESLGLQPRRWDGDAMRKVLHVLRHVRLPEIPDPCKSWDVGRTIDSLKEALARDEGIIDFGAYNSQVLPALARLGFTNLRGIDLDPHVLRGFGHGLITYAVADFYETGLEPASVSAVVAISAIEHGWRGTILFDEVARVLRPGGYFIFSTDYWPAKIDTVGLDFFGMTWTIFSRDEVTELLAAAARAGLRPVGDINLEVGSPIIAWNGRQYTFLHAILRKA